MAKVYLPIIRDQKGGRLPWGYIEAEPGSPTLLPVAEQFAALNDSLKYLDDGASLQKVCDWIESKCGRKISTGTLQRLYEADDNHIEGRKRREKLVENYTANNQQRKYKRKDEATRVALGIGNLKKKLTAKEKKLARLKEAKAEAEAALAKPPKAVEVEDAKVEVPTEVVEAVAAEPKPSNVIIPNAGPQTEFLASSEFEVLFGGAAGGGKSWAMIVDPLRTVHLASHKGIIFRHTNDQLRELIWMSKDLYPKVIPGAKFQEQKSTWVFPNGGTHWFRYLDRDDDVLDLHGQAFSWVGWDELTHWSTPFAYNFMRSRIRTTDPEMSPYLCVRASTNPGGPGHNWVKQTFIDPSPAGIPFPATNIDTGQPFVYPPDHAKAGQPLFYRKFIRSTLKDNPHLTQDTNYEASLLSLPEVQRRQLLEGDWDIIEGAAFPEFRRSVHVCKPFEIPAHWTRFRSCDWGFEQNHSVLWYAIEPSTQRLYVYRERYGKRTVSSDLADKVLADEAGENIQYGVLDSHAWDVRDGGTSPAKTMIGRGCMWRPAANRAPNSRTTTKQELHRRLQVTDAINENTGEVYQTASLIIFDTCVNLIKHLPAIQVDKTKPEDVDTDGDDHDYDSLRYGCASKPMYRQVRQVFGNNFNTTPQKQYNNFGFPV